MANRPVFTQFNTVAPILTQQYERYLPTAFDESLSVLQKINKVIRELNKIGDVSNGVVEQWNNVMEWLLDEGVSKEIINQLNNWLEDGTLASIINETLFAKKPDIFIQANEPLNPDSNTLWYEVKG